MTLWFVVRNFLFSLRLCIGVLLLFLGLFGISGGLSALIDPVGLKGADDNDPFGPPPTTLHSLTALVLSSAVFGSGLWLTLARRWQQGALHSSQEGNDDEEIWDEELLKPPQSSEKTDVDRDTPPHPE